MIESFLSGFLSDWAVDAVIDSIKTIPFLFFVFLFIEIFEHFWINKFRSFLKFSKKEGPVVGSAVACIPQCGFSVIASTLYSQGFITRGTIIAVFLATSDEAIPVLLMYPDYCPYILPLIGIKLLLAIPIGYAVDLLFRRQRISPALKKEKTECENHEEGCPCQKEKGFKKRDFIFHPLKHTIEIFVFILILTLLLNYLIEVVEITEIFETRFSHFAFLTPLVSSLFGLIPNCAASVGLVLMFIKGTISFGAMMAGLMTNSGLGLFVLFRNIKNKKEVALILSILIISGYITGLLIQTFWG